MKQFWFQLSTWHKVWSLGSVETFRPFLSTILFIICVCVCKLGIPSRRQMFRRRPGPTLPTGAHQSTYASPAEGNARWLRGRFPIMHKGRRKSKVWNMDCTGEINPSGSQDIHWSKALPRSAQKQDGVFEKLFVQLAGDTNTLRANQP